MDKELEFDYDLANLALKGKRFREAENKYLEIARKSNSSVAWCGVGLSKLGLIIDNESTIDEVFYCYNKAKTLDNSTINEVETFVLQNCFEIVKTLYSYFIHAHSLEEEAKRQKVMGVVTLVASSFMGTVSNSGTNRPSLYSDLTALGGTAIGFNGYANGKLKQLEATELKAKILSLIGETKSSVLLFVTNQTGKAKEFEQSVDKLHSDIIVQLLPEGQQNQILVDHQKPTNVFKDCSASEQFYVPQSRNVVFESLLDTLRKIGTIKYDNYEEGKIEAKSRYILQAVYIKALVIGVEENKSFVQLGANVDDVWGTGARKAIQKIKNNFSLQIAYS